MGDNEDVEQQIAELVRANEKLMRENELLGSYMSRHVTPEVLEQAEEIARGKTGRDKRKRRNRINPFLSWGR